MGDIIRISFCDRANFHKFMDVAIDEKWQVKVTSDIEKVPIVEFCAYGEEDGGPFLRWRQEVINQDGTFTIEDV